MSAQKKSDQINLLPEVGFENTTAGRVLSWILSTFRIIVIVTEIIVMIAFLSRFWLDAQNTDLNDEIKHNSDVLTASQNFEREFKDTQNRLKIFSDLTKNEGIYADVLNAVVSYLPDDLYLTAATLEGKSIAIEGITPNEVSVQQLIVNLNNSKKFASITLNELASNSNDPYLLNFKLDATFPKEDTK